MRQSFQFLRVIIMVEGYFKCKYSLKTYELDLSNLRL